MPDRASLLYWLLRARIQTVPVTSGDPQESVLEPILFLAYINDLPQDLVSQVRLFADDTVTYPTTESQYDSAYKETWTNQAWKSKRETEFNPSRCQVMQGDFLPRPLQY